jgi:hypothetical protein
MMTVWAFAATAPAAKAAESLGSFCDPVLLLPYGQAGDSCEGSTAYVAHYADVRVYTNERAGCVRGIGYYGEPHTSWVCAPRESFGDVQLPKDGGWYRGAIRNNNTNYYGRFSGAYFCCYSY